MMMKEKEKKKKKEGKIKKRSSASMIVFQTFIFLFKLPKIMENAYFQILSVHPLSALET